MDMKIGITYRLFLSILAATCMAILSMFLVMHWSINRGFIQYLSAMDQGRLQRAADRLGQAYAEHGSWDFLRMAPRGRIMRLMMEQPGDGAPDRPGPPEETSETRPLPPPMRGGPHRPAFRFILLDEERKPVFGDVRDADEANFRPILHDGKTVGYIGTASPKNFLTPPQLDFLKQQKFALVLAAVGMVLAVMIISLPLARRLVRPIKAMTRATRDLASGKYSVRVPVSSSDELGMLGRDFNAMALTLEKNEKARRQWVADISHELRTPLSILRGEIEALMEGVRDTTPEAIRSLHTEALRLHRLVDDLYYLALSDLGALTYRKQDLDPAGILKDSIESYRARFARKSVTVVSDLLPDRGPTVFADRERMQQLFSNLLDNSLKYTDSGGKLLISMASRNDEMTIDFEDSPPGVPEAELDRLFDRLYRVEGSRNRASGGAGLGLAICRNIVEAHAGTISAYPSQLGGIGIRIAIPLGGRS